MKTVALAVVLLLLAVALLIFRSSLGDPELEKGVVGESRGSLIREGRIDRDGAVGLSRERIRAKVESLLDVRKGEVGIIRIPARSLKNQFWPEGNLLVDGDSVSPSIDGLFSRDQAALMLEEVLRGGHRLKSVVGMTEPIGMAGEEFGVELTGVVDQGKVTDLQIKYTAHESEGVGQTGITVFNGQVVIMRSDPSPEAERMLIVTGAEPEPDE